VVFFLIVPMAVILAINEEKDSLVLAERILAGEGYRVTPFEQVKEAVEWLREHSPDLVLASGGRHGEKAKETVDLLKGAGIPGSKILLLTSPVSLPSVRKALRDEVRAVMQETADQDDLLRLVKAAVDL
jgi:DNA-binding NtrC family response regulator